MDSDSDSSLPNRKRGKVELPKFNDEDDSDSDDSLLANDNTTFRSSKRKKATKEDNILDDALKRSKSRLESEAILNKLKQEMKKHDDLIESAKTMKESKDTTKALEKEEKPKTAEAKEHHAALEEIADTQLTVTVGTRTIFSFQKDALPSSTTQALAYLQSILSQKGRSATLVQSILDRHLKQGTLHSFLCTKRLLSRAFPRRETETIPSSVLRWLFEIASTSSEQVDEKQPLLETFSRGSYLTLSSLWMERLAFSSDGWFLTTCDMNRQLNEWFGVRKRTELSSRLGQEKEEHTITKQAEMSAPSCCLAVSRFLHLWEIAFSQGMVYVGALKDIAESFVSLVVASLDPLFESSRTSADGSLSNLQKLLCHFLDAAKNVCETSDAYNSWLTDLAKASFTAIDDLGRENNVPGDKTAPKPWACQARMVRNMLREDATAALIPQLCDLIFQNYFKQSPNDWDAKSAAILTNEWAVCLESEHFMQWTAFSSSFMALRNLSLDLEKDGEVSAAIVELSFLSLLAGVASMQHDGTKCAPLYNAYNALEKIISRIYDSSKGLVLQSPNFLRVNYFCSCFRQYPRLEKLAHQASSEKLQSTVESFFSAKKQSIQ